MLKLIKNQFNTFSEYSLFLIKYSEGNNNHSRLSFLWFTFKVSKFFETGTVFQPSGAFYLIIKYTKTFPLEYFPQKRFWETERKRGSAIHSGPTKEERRPSITRLTATYFIILINNVQFLSRGWSLKRLRLSNQRVEWKSLPELIIISPSSKQTA